MNFIKSFQFTVLIIDSLFQYQILIFCLILDLLHVYFYSERKLKLPNVQKYTQQVYVQIIGSCLNMEIWKAHLYLSQVTKIFSCN